MLSIKPSIYIVKYTIINFTYCNTCQYYLMLTKEDTKIVLNILQIKTLIGGKTILHRVIILASVYLPISLSTCSFALFNPNCSSL